MGRRTKKKSAQRPGAGPVARFFLSALSVSFMAMIICGSYVAADALGMVPDYRTPKDRARIAMEEEREAVTKAKAACPELYPEPVEFYLKDAIDAYEKASDK